MNNNYAKFNFSQSYNIQTLTCLEPLHKLSDLASIAIIVALLLGDEFPRRLCDPLPPGCRLTLQNNMITGGRGSQSLRGNSSPITF